MNIAIFGDSYVNYYPDTCPDNELSWIELLSKDHSVTNFGLIGSAFTYSYKLHLTHRAHYDYSIFVVTDPGRIYIPAIDDSRLKEFPLGHFYGSPEFRQQVLDKTEKIKRIVDSIDVWINEWRDNVFENHLHNLMVGDLMNQPNILLIPGFRNSIHNYDKPYGNLTDLQGHELLLVDADTDIDHIICRRKCHFSAENHRNLYQVIMQAIDKKERILNLDKNCIVKPSKNLDYYISRP